MDEAVMTLYWRVGPFYVRLWFDYAPSGSGVEYRGAECDCDAWDAHRQLPPKERSCPHIDQIKKYIKRSDGGLPEDPDAEEIDLVTREDRPAATTPSP